MVMATDVRQGQDLGKEATEDLSSGVRGGW